MDAPVPFRDGVEHLLAEFGRLRLFLQREVLRLRASGHQTEDRFRGLYVSDEQVDAVLREQYSKRSVDSELDGAATSLRALSDRISRATEEVDARLAASLAAGIAIPFAHLIKAFGLSQLERDALLTCVAAEADLRFESLFSYAQNDVTRKRPTPDLILRLFCDSAEEYLNARPVFSREGVLSRNALVRFTDGQEREATFLARPLRAEERVVEFLLGQSEMDSRLRPMAGCFRFGRPLAELRLPSPLFAELRAAAHLRRSGGAIFYLHGPSGVGKKSAAGALSAEIGRPLLVADLRRGLPAEMPNSLVCSLLHREALLHGANLYLDHADALSSDDPGHGQKLPAFLQELRSGGYLVFVGMESTTIPAGSHGTAPAFHFEFPVPNCANRIELWSQAIRETRCRASAEADLASLAGKFMLTAGDIYSACLRASHRAALRGDGEVSMADLEAGARSESNQGLQRLAQKVECVSTWNDLVLPPQSLQQVREICAEQRHRHLVYSTWGFDRRLALCRGMVVLFHGQSGTGKTMASSVLARELGLDHYKFDLSMVVSKYIGETEKQLSRIFREAHASNAILFFDEADALFGKRSEVKDAHDRYANIEVAYLLQKIEEHEGIVILATNFRKNLDDAFTRRMQHIVEFPFPDAEHRERIWKNLIPAEAPLSSDVSFAFLARRFELAGGNIRNVVRAAAFLAADENSTMRMEHFIRATGRELQKMGKLPTRTDFREYFEMLQPGA
jgi:MoxR-like ATPase